MAETLLSPGVIAIENDQSFISQQPIQAGAAIVGPTVKGPVEIPTLVTSYSQYVNKFGDALTSGSDVYSYFTSITAYNYFQNGGTSLLVARVVTGSYTSATSSLMITGSGGPTTGLSPFVLQTISEGELMNSTSTETTNGALPSGSTDNIRWEILGSNTGSGQFNLLIRRGDDLTNNKTVLETWTNLSLDPKAPNFISNVIGDYDYNYNVTNNQIELSGSYRNASNYVRVKQVNYLTPDYFDNNGVAKNQFTGSIPSAASGTFGSATGTVKPGANFYNTITSTNTQGLDAGNYTNMINLLSNQDDYKFNLLTIPGLFYNAHSAKLATVISNTQNRGDNIFILDLVNYNSTVTAVTTEAANVNSSYAAAYWPWVQTNDPGTGKNVWVPASTMLPGVYAFNDAAGEPWFAPAGINRGGMATVVRVEQKLSQSNRDTLYLGKVNPIATFPGNGVVVYGQKTLQQKASALDRVNVRRLLIELKNYISQIGLGLVFEQNTIATRNSFLAEVNPYLDSIQQRQGLYAYKVIMDDTNNTADVIDRNQLVGQIYIQPTKTAEFIYLTFNVTPTGATFPA